MKECYICKKYYGNSGEVIDNNCNNCNFNYIGVTEEMIDTHPHFIELQEENDRSNNDTTRSNYSKSY